MSAPLPQAIRRRKKSPLPSLLGGGALLALAAFLAFGALGQSLEYFKTPSEYQMQEAALSGKLLRLGGLVKDADYEPKSLQLKFTITDGSVSYPVRYTGAVSEMFKENQGVIVRGRFEGGVFMATELVVKHSEEYRVPETASDIDQLKRVLEKGN